MNPDGPYVSVAALCESVLHEKNEQVSCIRFLDTLNVQVGPDAPEPIPDLRVRINAFVAFKSGAFIGTKKCMVHLTSPSGKSGKLTDSSPKSYPMHFQGDERGHNLILALDVPTGESGLYWIDVTLDDELYTRIPLKVNITRSSPPPIELENSLKQA